MVTFESYMTGLMAAAAKKQAILARDMSHLVTSDIGESLTSLINELLAKLKDEHVFAEEDPLYPWRRAEIKGSIIAIQTLLSMILEFARQHVEEGEEAPAWASASEEDAIEVEPPATVPRGWGSRDPTEW